MKNKRIYVSFTLLVLISLLSCSNLSDNLSESGSKEVKLIGSINITGAVPEEIYQVSKIAGTSKNEDGAKAAVPYCPAVDDTVYFYFVEAVAQNDGTKKTATVDHSGTSVTFSLPLDQDKTWAVTAGIKKVESGIETILLSDTVSKKISAEDSVLYQDFLIKPTQTETGLGLVNLVFEAQELSSFSYTDNDFDVSRVSATNTILVKNKNSGMVPGTYRLKIKLTFNSGNVYTVNQVINVYDNLTTNRWLEDSTGVIDADGLYSITTAKVDAYNAYSTFYVSSTGNDSTGTGSAYSPYEHISKAIEKCTNTGIDYTIYVSGSITESAKIEIPQGVPSVTIKSMDSTKATILRTVHKNPMIFVDVSSKLILEDIILDGDSVVATVPGAGIYSAGEITLINCEIKNAYTSDDTGGGAIYTQESAILDGCKIYDNHTTAANASGGGIFFAGGKLSLKDTEITDNQSNSNSEKDLYAKNDFSISGETIIGDVTLAAGKLIQLTDSLDNDASIKLTLSGSLSTTAGSETQVLSKGTELDRITMTDCKKISITNTAADGTLYCITPNADGSQGILAVKQNAANVSCDPQAYSMSFSSDYTLPGESKVVTLTVKDSANKSVNPDKYKLSILHHGSAVITSATSSITVPSWFMPGLYQLRAVITLNGTDYEYITDFEVRDYLKVNNAETFNAAIASSDSDKVVLSESFGLNAPSNPSVVAGKNVVTEISGDTKTINGLGEDVVICDSNNTRSYNNNKTVTSNDADNVLFNVTNGADVSLNNITFNAANLDSANHEGLFVHADGAGTVVTINSCKVDDLTLGQNGSLFKATNGAKIIFRNCYFTKVKVFVNSESGENYIIDIDSAAECEIYDCKFYYNGSNKGQTTSQLCNRTGVRNNGKLTVYRTTFQSNRCGEGGAINQCGGELRVYDSTFTSCYATSPSTNWGNATKGIGTGVTVWEGSEYAEFKNCTFSSNTIYGNNSGTALGDGACLVLGGPAIAIMGKTTILDSCTFSDNKINYNYTQGRAHGGAILIWNGRNSSSVNENVSFRQDGTEVSVDSYVSKYMSGNVVHMSSDVTGRGSNIAVVYSGGHGSLTVSGTAYTANNMWD